jgi:ABC-type nitrate/sulfonate/bicarbonate transport system permease component
VVSAQRLNRTGWLVFVGLVLIRELAARCHAPVRSYVSAMHHIMASLVQVIASGEIARRMLTTLMRFLTGYVIAAVIAVSLAIMLGYFPFGHSLLETLIEFLRPMPLVAIIPVAILLLGIGDGMIVAVTVYASGWPIIINTIEGVKHIGPVLVQTGRIFGLGPWRLLVIDHTFTYALKRSAPLFAATGPWRNRCCGATAIGATGSHAGPCPHPSDRV